LDQLHIRACLSAPVKEHKFITPIQEEIVANRALDPSSKLAIEQWAADEVYLGDEQAFQARLFYPAMDFRTPKRSRKTCFGPRQTF
jgi:hypothetical protein